MTTAALKGLTMGVPEDSITVRVLFFGHYRDITGGDALPVNLPKESTVADLADLLACREPRLSDLLSRTRAAVGADFASADSTLSAGDEVAFLPPMSGG